MTLPARFDHLAPYFRDGGPADDALDAHEHALSLLDAARDRVRDLSSPSKARAAEAADDVAAIEAASKRKPAPPRAATARLAADLAAERELVDALVRHVADVRAAALASIADDVPRRVEVLEERRASAAARVEHLARELGEALDEIDATAEGRAVLAAVQAGNALFLDGERTAVIRAASKASRGSAIEVPRTGFGDVEISDALAAIVAHAHRVPEVEVFDRTMTAAERLGSRTPTWAA